MKSNQLIIHHVQYWHNHCFCFGMQPFILHCDEGDNILIVNVKNILHTDPSFWLAGFGVLPNNDIFSPAASIKCTVDLSNAALPFSFFCGTPDGF